MRVFSTASDPPDLDDGRLALTRAAPEHEHHEHDDHGTHGCPGEELLSLAHHLIGHLLLQTPQRLFDVVLRDALGHRAHRCFSLRWMDGLRSRLRTTPMHTTSTTSVIT